MKDIKKNLDALSVEVYEDILPPPYPIREIEHQGLASSVRPIVKCPEFDGLDPENKFALRDFLTRFEYCTTGLKSKKEKLTYLKTCVTGRPFRLIHHLQENSNNYEIALQILKDNYWDEEAIREEIFAKLFLLESGTFYDSRFLMDYLSQLKYELAELDSTMNYNFLKKDSGSGALAAYIIFQRLSARLKEELVRVEETPYPSLTSILNGSMGILKSWRTTQASTRPIRYRGKDTWQKAQPVIERSTPRTLENFHVHEERKSCNLCLQEGHESQDCQNYTSFQQRQHRCRELGLCFRCTSSDHFGNKCPIRTNVRNSCRRCSASSHATTMCPDTSTINGYINTGVSDRQCLFPISRITLRRGHKTVEARCMVDTGSQNSYFSGSVLRRLQCDPRSVLSKDLDIVTFLGRRRCRFKQITAKVLFPSGISRQLPMLIDKGLDLRHRIDQLPTVMKNLREQDYTLDTDLGESPEITLDGLLGVDLLQFMGSWEMVQCMNGVAWSTRGLIPLGDPRNFLQPGQKSTISPSSMTAYHETVNSVTCPASMVNSVLEAVPSYPDPYEEIFAESSVERGLEWIYSVKSLGLSEEEVVSDYDSVKIKEFMDQIEYREDCYWVQLPWHMDKLAKVNSGYHVALKVLERVVNDLEKKGVYEEYLGVFAEQEKENRAL